MQEHKISKRPKFEYISHLKGKNHSMYGKKWETLLGNKEAKMRKEIYSKRFRELIIKRLENMEIPFRDTSIERAIAWELTKRKIKFVRQYRIDKFVCDFAIPEYKIAIECDGDYWHANPKIYKENEINDIQKIKVGVDKEKNTLFREKGWIVLRFFESEIKKSVSGCVDIIVEQVKKVANPLDGI